MLPLPSQVAADHDEAPEPRSDHQQRGSDIEPGVRLEGGIERVEHRSSAKRDRDHRRNGADDDQQEASPGPARADKALLQRGLRDRIAEAHRDQRRENVSHRRAVRGQRAVVPLRIADPRVERAAHQHLPCAEEERETKHSECEPEVCEDEPPIHQHSSVSPRSSHVI